MPKGVLFGLMPAENSVTTPAGVMRPIRFPSASANQRLPSGPAVMPVGLLCGLMPAENSVSRPAGVMRPIRFPSRSVNHRLPSGPDVMPTGPPDGILGADDSRMATAAVALPVARTSAMQSVAIAASITAARRRRLRLSLIGPSSYEIRHTKACLDASRGRPSTHRGFHPRSLGPRGSRTPGFSRAAMHDPARRNPGRVPVGTFQGGGTGSNPVGGALRASTVSKPLGVTPDRQPLLALYERGPVVHVVVAPFASLLAIVRRNAPLAVWPAMVPCRE